MAKAKWKVKRVLTRGEEEFKALLSEFMQPDPVWDRAVDLSFSDSHGNPKELHLGIE